MIVNYEVGAPSAHLQARLVERAEDKAMTHLQNARWRTDAKTLVGAVVANRTWVAHDGEQVVLVDWGLLTATVRIHVDGGVWVQVVAEDRVTATAFIDMLRENLPPRTTVDDEATRVEVSFWSLSAHGPANRSRMLDVLRWENAAGNYVDATAVELEHLMGSDFAPGVGGQLVIWHGPPGTGKTSALRALAWEWRRWCDLHYITDPEAFFGQQASYMLEVLLSTQGADEPVSVDGAPSVPEPDARASDGRWRLLVLEDTGEMLSADAKERAGQGLSRLLNVVDGMIGQGLRVLVLVTTNEPLRALHEAIRRPGRCAALIEFPLFGPEDANAWLSERGDTDSIATKAVALADLFSLVAGRGVEHATPVGFGAA